MPAPIIAAAGTAAAMALSDPYVRGALIGTGVYGADQALQSGINKGLRSKHKTVRKIADKAAGAYEAVDKSHLAGIWKGALTGAASDAIGRKSAKFIRDRNIKAKQAQKFRLRKKTHKMKLQTPTVPAPSGYSSA